MSSPRVMHLIDSGGFYGAERALLNLVAAPGCVEHTVLRLGHKSGDRSRFVQALEMAGVRCHEGVGVHTLIGELRWILKHQRRDRPTHLHCHGYKPTILGILVGRLTGTRVLVTQHGFTNKNHKVRLYNWLSIQACRRSGVDVVCVSEPIRNKYAAHGLALAQLTVVPNAVPATQVSSLTQRLEARSRLHCRPDDFVIGFVGRLSVEKGPDRFVQLVAQLRQRGVPVAARVLGEGPMGLELQRQVGREGIGDDLKFLGFREDAALLLPGFDVVVVPSRTEGVPMTILEAMSASVPVVAFAVGGIPSVVRDHETGCLIEPGCIDKMADAVEALFLDDTQRRLMGEQGREVVEHEFSIAEQVRQYELLYAGAVSTPRVA